MAPKFEYVCIHRAPHAVEGNLVRGLLEREGIPVRLTGESLVGGYAGVTGAGDVRVTVPHRYEPAARRIIDAFNTKNDATGSWVCRACSERNEAAFETCWNCATDPSEPNSV